MFESNTEDQFSTICHAKSCILINLLQYSHGIDASIGSLLTLLNTRITNPSICAQNLPTFSDVRFVVYVLQHNYSTMWFKWMKSQEESTSTEWDIQSFILINTLQYSHGIRTLFDSSSKLRVKLTRKSIVIFMHSYFSILCFLCGSLISTRRTESLENIE